MQLAVRLALWSLWKRNARVDGDCVIDGDLVVMRNFPVLVRNGYCDDRGVVSDVGKRLVTNKLSPSAKYPTLRKIETGGVWRLEGLHATNGVSRISRYLILRLVDEGYLQVDPGGVVTRLTDEVRVTIMVPKARLLEVLSNYRVVSRV